MEARSLKLGCQQGRGPSEGSGEESFLASGGSTCSLACRRITAVSLSLSLQKPGLLFLLPVHPLLSFIRTLVSGFRDWQDPG